MKRLSSSDQGTNQIHNVANPTSPQDAATKSYADGKVSKSGDTITGDLTVTGYITAPHEIDTDYIGTYSSINGGTQIVNGLATDYITGRTSNVGKISFVGYGLNTILDLIGPVGSNLLTDYLKITSVVAGTPTLEATGNSTNISVNIKSKGSGAIQANGVQVATLTGTETLTNKRITPRVQSVTSAATITPAGDTNDLVVATAQAAALTLANPTGTPTDGQKLIVRLKATGAFAITYGTLYLSSGIATLPVTTVSGKTITLGLVYDATATKWVLMALDGTGY